MNLRDTLIRDEDFRLKPYRDTKGKLTIGVGRNLDDVGISRQEGLLMLENDISDKQLSAATAFPWFPKLSVTRQDVIVMMLFNMGLGGLLQFKGFLAAVEREDFEVAAGEMLNSRWAGEVGDRAKRLSQMMRSDSYPTA